MTIELRRTYGGIISDPDTTVFAPILFLRYPVSDISCDSSRMCKAYSVIVVDDAMCNIKSIISVAKSMKYLGTNQSIDSSSTRHVLSILLCI